MSYTAPTITDRIAVGDNKFSVEILPDGRYVLTPAPDSVTEPGTDINKALLQPVVDAVEEHDVEIYTNIPADIATAIAGTDISALSNLNKWAKITVTTANYAYNSSISRWQCTTELPEYKGRRIIFYDVKLNYNDDGNTTYDYYRGTSISSDKTIVGYNIKFHDDDSYGSTFALFDIGFNATDALFGTAESYGAILQEDNTLLWTTYINPTPPSGNPGAYTGDVYVLNI